MSQYSQSIKTRAYSSEGTQAHAFERAVVSNQDDFPNSVLEAGHTRFAYKTQRIAKRGRFSVSLPWALLLIMLTVGIIGAISISKIQQGEVLRDEFAQLQNLYTVSEKERLILADRLNSAKDSNFICYYASQNLGMKLALHDETIQVIVPHSESYQQFSGFYGNAASKIH